MTLKSRVRKYLEKQNAPVSREKLMDVAMKAGVKKWDISNLLYEMSKNGDDDPDIGVWWGFSDYNAVVPQSEKTTWFRLYPMSESERRARRKLLKAF